MGNIDIATLREEFKTYLSERYPNNKHISATVSMAFFLDRHGDMLGIDFQEVLSEKQIPVWYCERLKKHFETRGRKNPSSDASTYRNALGLLLEYISGQAKYNV